jgi:hypothetical protein
MSIFNIGCFGQPVQKKILKQLARYPDMHTFSPPLIYLFSPSFLSLSPSWLVHVLCFLRWFLVLSVLVLGLRCGGESRHRPGLEAWLPSCFTILGEGPPLSDLSSFVFFSSLLIHSSFKFQAHCSCWLFGVREEAPVSADLGPARRDYAGVTTASYGTPSPLPGSVRPSGWCRHDDGTSWYGTASASTARRRLRRHSDGQRQRRPAATASTAW